MAIFGRRGRETAEDRSWLDDLEATITFSTLQVPEVLRALEVRQGSERSTTFAAAFDLQDHEAGSYVAQIGTLAAWTVVVEPNGFVTSLPDVRRRLSIGGRCASLFWNVNAVMSFAYVVDGITVRAFDPLLFDDVEGPALPEEHGLRFGDPAAASPRVEAMSLLERITGSTVDRAWLLDVSRPTWIVDAPLD